MTTSFARVRCSTGTVIGPAGGGAAFAAASEGETMKWLRPRPAARLTTAVTAMIQIVRVEPVMALMVGVPFRFRSATSSWARRRAPLRRQRRPGGPRRPSPASALCPSVGHRGGPRLELRLVGVVELLLVLEVDVRLRLGVLEAVAAGEVGNCRLDLLGGDRRDLRVDLFLDGRVVLLRGVRRHVGVRVVPDRLDLRVDLVLLSLIHISEPTRLGMISY